MLDDAVGDGLMTTWNRNLFESEVVSVSTYLSKNLFHYEPTRTVTERDVTDTVE
jgi:hypothetical protein